MANTTTIQITFDTKDRLHEGAAYGETNEEIIKRILDERDRLLEEVDRLAGDSK